MEYRSHALIALCVTHFLLACGGQTAQGGAGGRAEIATAGHAGRSESGGGGNGAGGDGAIGGGGGGVVCCHSVPVCPSPERRAEGSECPGQGTCHQVSRCCSSIWCVRDEGSGGAAGTAGGSSADCHGTTCQPSQACIAYRTVGGVQLIPDAGGCPVGKHLEGGSCQADFAYRCADLNGACKDQPVSCACAQPPTNSPGVCPVGYQSCSAPGSDSDPSATLVCQALVP